MSPLDMALQHAEYEGIPVFPCINAPRLPEKHKTPHTRHGFQDASCDPDMITAWWRRWPTALIGMPTGRASRRWALDIDVKRPAANGFDTLEELGHAILPTTPMVHTASGGLHAYFDAGERELRNSAGVIGPGLDVRGAGGYVILPSPGSGYVWDPVCNFNRLDAAPAPAWLWPASKPRAVPTEPVRPVAGLSPYGAAAIEAACGNIVRAGPGNQERTLHCECFSIGTLAGTGAVPEGLALDALRRAASTMQDYDTRRPWQYSAIEAKVNRAFTAGLSRPREVRRAVA
jgi:Bifunctional DNA primase/polymerase, N-terminal